jgi:hypothetical protein
VRLRPVPSRPRPRGEKRPRRASRVNYSRTAVACAAFERGDIVRASCFDDSRYPLTVALPSNMARRRCVSVRRVSSAAGSSTPRVARRVLRRRVTSGFPVVDAAPSRRLVLWTQCPDVCSATGHTRLSSVKTAIFFRPTFWERPRFANNSRSIIRARFLNLLTRLPQQVHHALHGRN